jgi:DNA-directed RNA polymerase specialized sigma24 family protein
MRRGSNACMNPAVSPAASLHDTAALYRRHWPAMCAYARAKGCETHDAEDAVQELFARLVAQGQHERAAAISRP